MLTFVREVRAAGLPVGLATNATDRLDADLARLGLVGEVDVVVNSSAIGVHKPAPEFFERGLRGDRRPRRAVGAVRRRRGPRRPGGPGRQAVGVPVDRAGGAALPAGRLDQGRPAPS